LLDFKITMFLKNLSLVNYKNFDSKSLDFDPTKAILTQWLLKI